MITINIKKKKKHPHYMKMKATLKQSFYLINYKNTDFFPLLMLVF
jgi:hypothetical protein